jgi:putative DNA primase/helicase
MRSDAILLDQVIADRGGAAAVAVRDGVVLVNAADITPAPVRWLWPGWLALGKLHILAGAPGQGKTTIALAAVAAVTGVGRWPDGTRCDPGSALIWSGEDDPGDTLLPRLLAMGADPARVNFITATRIAGEVLPFDPARDLVDLAAAAERIGDVRLLVVDPVVSAVAGDSHKNTEVRRALQPLVDLAGALDCAVLGISHFAKGGAGRDPAERVVGSVAFSAVARVVMVAARIKGDDGGDRRVLARAKSNIGPDGGGFEYALDQVEVPGHAGLNASRVTWGPAVEGTARELLAEPENGADGGSARDNAADFLRETLKGGPVPTKTLEAEAKAAGIAWRTVRRAADEVGVWKTKGGMGSGWYWSLSKMATKEANLSNVESWTSWTPSVDTFGAGPTDDLVETARRRVAEVAPQRGWTDVEAAEWHADAQANPAAVLEALQ